MKRDKAKNKKGKDLMVGSLPRAIFPKPGTTLTQSQSLGPTYDIDLVAAPIIFTAAGGAMALNVGMSPATAITTWASRWQTIFQEYVVLGVRASLRVTNNGGFNQGSLVAWLDEQSFAVPTSTNAGQARGVLIAIGTGYNGNGAQQDVTWMPHDPKDFDFNALSGAVSPFYIKLFADNANYGTNASQNFQVQLERVYRIRFRGLA